jgi:hypothetical protein
MAVFATRYRKLFLAATVVLATTQLSAVGQASAEERSPANVTFASVPATAALVAHYTVDQHNAAARTKAAVARAGGARAEQPARRTRIAAKVALSSRQRTGANGLAGGAARTPAESGRASFSGMQSSRSICPYLAAGCNPPDMAIAASPRWVLQGVNTSFEVLDPRGHVQAGWPRNAQTFFGVPDEPNNCDPASGNQPFMSDPRAFYDPVDNRFWAGILQVEGAFGVAADCPFQTAYYLAVSRTSDPRGSWNVYKFDMSLGTTNAADFTQFGFDRDAVYFSANMFNNAGTAYEYAELFEANKRMMERGSASFTAAGFRSLTATGPSATFLADTVQPVLTLGSGAEGEYFVDTFDAPDPVTGHQCQDQADACSGLALWTLRNPVGHDRGGPPPTLTGTYVPTRPYVFPPAASQPTCAQCIDASDLRVSGTPVYRDGTVHAAWETAIGNGTQTVPGIEYAQVKPARASRPNGAKSSYYYFGGDTAVAYPAVMPDGDGHVVMVYDLMSSTVNPQTRFVAADAEDARFSGAGHLIKAGEAPYRPGVCGVTLPVCRWGDYSAASGDRRGAVWLAGQYANANTGPSTDPDFSSRNWGTWITGLTDH